VPVVLRWQSGNQRRQSLNRVRKAVTGGVWRQQEAGGGHLKKGCRSKKEKKKTSVIKITKKV